MSDMKFVSLNTIILSGRLTRDPEIKTLKSGTKNLTMSLAFERSYKDANGEYQKVASFIDVVTWEKVAETCSKNGHKGSPVVVEGYLQTRTYQSKEGHNVKVTEIVAQRVQFMEWNEKREEREDRAPEPEPDPASDVPF